MRDFCYILSKSTLLILQSVYLYYSLRDRLSQVEEQERKLEQELESVRAELELTKDINTSQEQTILDLQQQQSDQKSANKVSITHSIVCLLWLVKCYTITLYFQTQIFAIHKY